VAVTFPDHGTLFVTTESNDGLHRWRNSIDVVWSTGAGAPLPSETVITDFVNFLKGAQRNDCSIIEYKLVNWARGNLPLIDQPPIWAITTSIACSNQGTGTAFPDGDGPHDPTVGEVCVLMAKTPFGLAYRKGHLFLRNVARSVDVVSTAGGPPTLDPSTAAGFISDLNGWASARLSSHLTDSDLPRYCNVHLSTAPSSTPFDSPIGSVVFQRLAMHDISKKDRR
jgi:hypothetical protein